MSASAAGARTPCLFSACSASHVFRRVLTLGVAQRVYSVSSFLRYFRFCSGLQIILNKKENTNPTPEKLVTPLNEHE